MTFFVGEVVMCAKVEMFIICGRRCDELVVYEMILTSDRVYASASRGSRAAYQTLKAPTY